MSILDEYLNKCSFVLHMFRKGQVIVYNSTKCEYIYIVKTVSWVSLFLFLWNTKMEIQILKGKLPSAETSKPSETKEKSD